MKGGQAKASTFFSDSRDHLEGNRVVTGFDFMEDRPLHSRFRMSSSSNESVSGGGGGSCSGKRPAPNRAGRNGERRVASLFDLLQDLSVPPKAKKQNESSFEHGVKAAGAGVEAAPAAATPSASDSGVVIPSRKRQQQTTISTIGESSEEGSWRVTAGRGVSAAKTGSISRKPSAEASPGSGRKATAAAAASAVAKRKSTPLGITAADNNNNNKNNDIGVRRGGTPPENASAQQPSPPLFATSLEGSGEVPEERSTTRRRVGWAERLESSNGAGGGGGGGSESLGGVGHHRPGSFRGVGDTSTVDDERQVSSLRLSSYARGLGTGGADGGDGGRRISRPSARHEERGGRNDERATSRFERTPVRPRLWIPQDGFDASQWMTQEPDPTTEPVDDDVVQSDSIALGELGRRGGGDSIGGSRGAGASGHSMSRRGEEKQEENRGVDRTTHNSSWSRGRSARDPRGNPTRESSGTTRRDAALFARARGEAGARIREAADGDSGDDQGYSIAETTPHAGGLTEEAFEWPADEGCIYFDDDAHDRVAAPASGKGSGGSTGGEGPGGGGPGGGGGGRGGAGGLAEEWGREGRRGMDSGGEERGGKRREVGGGGRAGGRPGGRGGGGRGGRERGGAGRGCGHGNDEQGAGVGDRRHEQEEKKELLGVRGLCRMQGSLLALVEWSIVDAEGDSSTEMTFVLSSTLKDEWPRQYIEYLESKMVFGDVHDTLAGIDGSAGTYSGSGSGSGSGVASAIAAAGEEGLSET